MGNRPGAERIQEVAREVISRPEYRLGSDGQEAPEVPLIIRIFLEFLRWTSETFKTLFDVSPILAWFLFIAMIAILAIIVVQFAFFIKSLLTREQRGTTRISSEASPSDPKVWEGLAEEAARAGDFLGAVRSLFMASVTHLERVQGKPFRRGMTNREVSRRFENTAVFEPIQTIVRILERTWFGFAPCFEGDYASVLASYEQLKQHLALQRLERLDAHRA